MQCTYCTISQYSEKYISIFPQDLLYCIVVENTAMYCYIVANIVSSLIMKIFPTV